MVDIAAMDLDMATTTARGLLMLMPSLLLILTMATMAMAWATMVDIAAMDLDMATTMARGLLMPSLLLIPTTLATAMVWAMDTMADMALAMVDITMARGLLMLMPSLLLILTTMEATTVMAWDTAMVDTAMDVATTGDKSSHPKGDWAIHEDLSVNHQLLCQQQMDYFSLSFIPHLCCQFQCCQPSPTRNGKQEAIENQNVLIRQIKMI